MIPKNREQESRGAYGTAVSGVVIHLNQIIVKWSSPKSNRPDSQSYNVRFTGNYRMSTDSETAVLKSRNFAQKIGTFWYFYL